MAGAGRLLVLRLTVIIIVLVFFAGCGYQYSAMLEPLVKLVRSADRMSVNPDLPVVLAGIPKKMGGTIGVIGPTRMDYRKAISTVNYMSGILSYLMAGVCEEK